MSEFTFANGVTVTAILPGDPLMVLPVLPPTVRSVNGEIGDVVIDVADLGAVADDDVRLSDARTPLDHAASHASAGSDPITIATSQVTGLDPALAGRALTTDPRFTDARTPLAHEHDADDLNVTLEEFGGVTMIQPTGIAATDTAAIMAAHAALPATGGEILLATGTFVVTGGGVVFTKPVRLVGQGCSGGPPSSAEVTAGVVPTSITTIQCASATANAITAQADGCQFSDFHMVNTSGTTPTNGAGIAVTAKGSGNRYDRVTIRGFYRNWDIVTGHEWAMEQCTSWDFVRTGCRIQNTDLPDGGDMGIMNSQFIAGPVNTAPQSGVEWVSGGGLRFIGNKINKRGSVTLTLGLFLHPADGISTSVILINDNSIENCNYGVYCDDTGNSGTGNLSKVTVVGNEFLVVSRVMALVRAQSGKLLDVAISNNVFTSAGSTTAGILLGNIANVSIGANVWKTITGYLTLNAGVTGLMLDGSMAFTTAARPAATAMAPGSRYYDTTLSRLVWTDGATWKEPASGEELTAHTHTSFAAAITAPEYRLTAAAIDAAKQLQRETGTGDLYDGRYNLSRALRKTIAMPSGAVSGDYYDLYQFTAPSSLEGTFEVSLITSGSGYGIPATYRLPTTYAMDWLTYAYGYTTGTNPFNSSAWVTLTPEVYAGRHLATGETLKLQAQVINNAIRFRILSTGTLTGAPSVKFTIKHSSEFAGLTITEYSTSGNDPAGSFPLLPNFLSAKVGSSAFWAPIGIKTNAPTYDLDNAGTTRLTGNTGFFGATPIARPTVSGSRNTGAALASVLTGLANLGLITNSSDAVSVPEARGAVTTAVTASDLTWTLATYQTLSMSGGMTSAGGSPATRLVVPTAGLYYIIAQILFATNATGFRQIQVRINSGGSSVGGTRLCEATNIAFAGTGTTVATSRLARLAASDTIDMWGYQSSGGNLGFLTSANTYCFLEVVRISD